MSTGAIIGGVLFLMLIVIGVVVYFMMMKDEESTLGPTAGPAPGPAPAPGPSGGGGGLAAVNAQTIDLKLTSGKPITMVQLMVYDNQGKIITPNATITHTELQPGWPGGALGQTSTEWLSDINMFSPFHTYTQVGADGQFVKMDFGRDVKISRIVILNRWDHRGAVGSRNWNQGMTIELTNSSGTSVATGTVSGLKHDDAGIIEFNPVNKMFVKTFSTSNVKPIKNVKRVRFVNSEPNSDLIINELEVYDESGTNVARTATASGSSEHAATWSAANLNDGQKTAGTNPFHSLNQADTIDWAQLVFDQAVNVKKVVITNRSDGDGTEHRINNTLDGDHLEFYDDNDNLIHVSPYIIDSGKKGTFTYEPGEIIGRWKSS
jgi:hypothetical protein